MTINKKLLVSQTQQLLEEIREGSPPFPPDQPVKVFLGSDTHVTMRQGGTELDLTPANELPTAYIIGSSVGTFGEAVANLMADPEIKRTTAPAAVEKHYQELVHTLWVQPREQRDIGQAVTKLVDRLRSAACEWRVFIPIVNLTFSEVEELPLGSVILRPTGDWLGHPFSTVINVIGQSQGAPEQLAFYQIDVGARVRDLFMNLPAVAETTVWCDESLVREAAGANVDAALNMLRCIGAALHPRSNRMLIGRVGDVAAEFEGVLAIVANGERFTMPLQRVGYIMPYNIDANFVRFARETLALDYLSDVMSKEASNRTKLEEAIARAVQIAGVATLRPAPEEQLVQFCTALEVLLIPGGEFDEKKAAFCERVAWVIGRDSDDRVAVGTRAGDIYRARSDVIHRGKIGLAEDILTDAARFLMLALARLAMRRNKFDTVEDVVAWVNERKLR